MELEDENFFEDISETLDDLSEAMNLNNTKSKSPFSRWGEAKSNRNDAKKLISSGKSNWRRNTTDSPNTDPWRNGYSANSSRTWKWNEKRRNEAAQSDDEDGNKNNDQDDVSEALNNLFKLMNCDDNTESKIHPLRSSNWRDRNTGDSSGTTDSWRTKYNADKTRKWKYERRKDETSRSNNNGDSWRTNLGNDNEDAASDDESPVRTRNKNCAENHKISYRDKPRRGQNISRRNTFHNPIRSHINLSLREILKLETEEVPEKVILALVDKMESFKKIIGGNLSFENVVLLLRVFNKICSSHFDENRGRLITSIVNGKFLEKISQYLLLLAVQDPEDKDENMFFWENPEQFWNNLLVLYENIFEFMPATACDVLPKIVKATIISINDTEKYQEVQLSTNVKNKLEKLQETLTNYIEKQNQVKNNVEVEDPPNCFRFLSIYPTVNEITTQEVPFIRPIIKNGAYQSVEHYLDVQFRLLKEDFTASLRNGICTYLQKDENKKPEQQFDVRIYENVQFVSPHITRDRVASLLQYTTNINKKQIEESSKRFIYGSLVCFTSNNFKEISFGTVVDSDKKYLKNGQIIVDIREGHVELNKKYTMIECTVFFEPYYQVLTALKKIYDHNFPFKDYIIDVTSNTKPPKYIKETTVGQLTQYSSKFKILSPETWPKPKEVGLNESQFKAFQSALTQEFSIIQGPPGTGKTYTTLKIVEFLLKNKVSLGYSGPIFVICFTNHALDQFLEGILPYTHYLLRVGGQSKSEVMKTYGFHKYREILRKLRRREYLLYNTRARQRNNEDLHITEEEEAYFWDHAKSHVTTSNASEYYETLDKLEIYQNLITSILSNDGIINFSKFEKIYRGLHNTWFGQKTNGEIIKWLMHFDEKFDTEDKYQQEEDNKIESEDSLYSQWNELYEERKIIDDVIQYIEDPYSYEYNFIVTPSDYYEKLKILKEEMHDMKTDDKENQTYKFYANEEKKIKKQINYLKWRLKQNKMEGNPPDLTIPPEEMTPDERWQFYRSWLHTLKDIIYEKISEMDYEYRLAHRAHQEICELGDLYIMQKMRVIGMTTTGAARHQRLLQKLQCPIVIAEEAAEVLESHIVVSLTKQCQQLILIGDHKQLRPTTAQYNLATKYNLEISLFERMVQNGIHCYKLNIQHRMRPEIAKLIVPAIYPKLENSLKVEDFPPILGVTKNMFFIDHSIYEDHVHNSSSHKNMYEAKYLIRLASYLIKQGYEPKDITILATYKGQMYLLLEERRGRWELDEVRITVVDNFQGEENKIILLSLVRSNREASIGFLKIENRVCVALSRAKEGFFIIGNMNNLEKSSKIWPKIKQALIDQNAISETLTLQCQIHGSKTAIRSWEDFAQVPEGGCNIPCNAKLNFGHICKLMCHPDDPEHEKYACPEKCTKTCPRRHPCQHPCFSGCRDCNILIRTNLQCGHIQSIPCYVNPEKYHCKAKVEAIFPCGHTGEKKCHEDPKDVDCLHPCEELIECGHMYKILCRSKNNPKLSLIFYECQEPCTKFKKGCSTNEHKCPLKCFEECAPCTEMIKKQRNTCTHKVRVQCNEDIDDSKCREKCRKMLPCGHHCPNLCYEECGNCRVMVTKTIESCGHSITIECSKEVDISMCQNDECFW